MKYWVGERGNGDTFVYYRAASSSDLNAVYKYGNEKVSCRELTDRESRAIVLISLVEALDAFDPDECSIGDVWDTTDEDRVDELAWYTIYEEFK